MARPTLQTGDIWSDDLSNAAGRPILDGQELYGHGDKVIDSWLDDSPDQIKSRFYGWRDRVQVSQDSGLQISYTGASVRLGDGSIVALSPGTFNLPDDTTGFVFINDAGAVAASTQLPNECIPLANFTTAAGAITNLSDIRYQVVEQVQPVSLPSTQSPFIVGEIREYAGPTPPSGWLICDGSIVNQGDYPTLYSAIGTTWNTGGEPAGTFRLPDRRGRVGIGAGQGPDLANRTLGSYGGAETHRLTTAEMPSHSHGVTQTPHGHGVNQSPHGHGVSDPGHAHSLNPSIAFNRRDPANNYGSGGGLGLGPLNGIPTGAVGTGIGINPGYANINVAGSNANISVNGQGGSGAHNNMQPYAVSNYIIRAV